jgi:hypothetical protein
MRVSKDLPASWAITARLQLGCAVLLAEKRLR